jgi:chromosome segregation ATPase
MSRHILHKLDKVLALADSDQDGEAVSAVRMARQLLSNDGLSFGDLARVAAEKPKTERTLGLFSGAQRNIDNELIKLRERLDDLQDEIETQEVHVDYWRQRAADLEQQVTAAQDETRRWRQLARDTVEKLWDLSVAVQEIDRETGTDIPKKSE